jgi:hypothetical protein
VEQILKNKLCGSPGEEQPKYRHYRASEVRVRSGSGWKGLVGVKKNLPARSSGFGDELGTARKVINGAEMISLACGRIRKFKGA